MIAVGGWWLSQRDCHEMKTEVGSFHVGQLNVFGGWVGRQLDANFGSSGQAGFKIHTHPPILYVYRRQWGAALP